MYHFPFRFVCLSTFSPFLPVFHSWLFVWLFVVFIHRRWRLFRHIIIFCRDEETLCAPKAVAYPGFFYARTNILGKPPGSLGAAELCKVSRFGRQIVKWKFQLGIFAELIGGTLLIMLRGSSYRPPPFATPQASTIHTWGVRPLRPPEYVIGNRFYSIPFHNSLFLKVPPNLVTLYQFCCDNLSIIFLHNSFNDEISLIIR